MKLCFAGSRGARFGSKSWNFLIERLSFVDGAGGRMGNEVRVDIVECQDRVKLELLAAWQRIHTWMLSGLVHCIGDNDTWVCDWPGTLTGQLSSAAASNWP